jgi:sortase (surface protein transpeptidase)
MPSKTNGTKQHLAATLKQQQQKEKEKADRDKAAKEQRAKEKAERDKDAWMNFAQNSQLQQGHADEPLRLCLSVTRCNQRLYNCRC